MTSTTVEVVGVVDEGPAIGAVMISCEKWKIDDERSYVQRV